jgi:hypothetical protein
LRIIWKFPYGKNGGFDIPGAFFFRGKEKLKPHDGVSLVLCMQSENLESISELKYSDAATVMPIIENDFTMRVSTNDLVHLLKSNFTFSCF